MVEQVFCAFLGTSPREDFIPYVADFYLQLENVKWTIVSGIVNDSLVMSVRNLGYSRNAGEFVRKYFADIGSAGGHRAMAKAVVPLRRLPRQVRQPAGRRIHRPRPRHGARVPARAPARREEARQGLTSTSSLHAGIDILAARGRYWPQRPMVGLKESGYRRRYTGPGDHSRVRQLGVGRSLQTEVPIIGTAAILAAANG